MDAKLGESVRAPGVFGGRESRAGLEVADFTGDLGIERRRVEVGDALDAALACNDLLPQGRNVIAQRSHSPQASDHHSSVKVIACHKIKRGSLAVFSRSCPGKPHETLFAAQVFDVFDDISDAL